MLRAHFSQLKFIALLTLLLASACASPQLQPAARSSGELTAAAPFDSELFYQLLAGEMAEKQDQPEMAAQFYIEAARTSSDESVAKRATQLAVYAKQYELAVEGAKRWLALADETAVGQTEPLQVMAALYLRQGEHKSSANTVGKLIDVASNRNSGYQTALSTLSREQDRDGALQVGKILVEAEPEAAGAHYLYAILARAAQQLDLALKHIDRSLTLAPSDEHAWNGYARIMQARSETAVAAERMAKFVATGAATLATKLTYARLLIGADKLPQAQVQLEEILRIEPDNAEAIYALAIMALNADQDTLAEKQFLRLVEIDKRSDAAHYYLGQIAEGRKEFDAAKQWYQGVPRGEYAINSRVRMLVIEGRQGKLEMARRYLKVFRERHTQHSERIYLAEGDMLRELELYQEALELYAAALEEHADNNDLRYARAMVAERLEQYELAEKDLRSIISAEPKNASALNALGYTLADRTERYDEARELIERAYELRPNDPAIIDSMGWIYYRLGKIDEALLFLRRALKLMPDPEIASHLGEVLWVQGERDEARSVWTQALDENPESGVLKRVIERFSP